MRRHATLRTLATLGLVAVLSVPHATSPQTCTNTSARNLLGGALADTILNPGNMEDTQFFTSQSGFPNIFFVIDTSGSMVRLPPNGPPFQSATVTLPLAGVAGCGAEPQFGGVVVTGALAGVANRSYHSPCGATPYDNLPYQGDPSYVTTGVNYAVAAAVCPYYTPSNTYTTGVPGYDQDFYSDTDSLTAGGGVANLFPKNFVFHDSNIQGGWSRDTSGTNPNGDYGDGWTFDNHGNPALFPWRDSSNTIGRIADFCAAQGTTLQGGYTRQAICTACLSRRGWYYDGNNPSQDWPERGTALATASLWYTGNYLNFFPPKFMIARRVVKDVISNQSRIRMALGQFLGTSGISVVDDFNPSCQSVFGGGSWENNRSTYVNSVNTLSWGGGTPLSMALYQIGQYYHSPSLPWFGSSNGWLPASLSNANQSAVCWSCQNSSVIILTDGSPSVGDGYSLPSGSSSIASSNSGIYAGATTTGIKGASAADCPECYEFSGTGDYMNNLTKVAFYLHNYDLRNDPAGTGSNGTLDCQGMAGKQVLDVYTVGFGTSQLENANDILRNAAKVGGGLFFSADAADELKGGIFKVFQVINERSTSFSVATVSTLQTTTGHSVIVPRFDPSRDATWPGHLYRYELYSEFVNACTPNGTGDFDCDGACQSVFLKDKDGDFIAEDGNGHFVKTGAYPACELVPLCQASGRCTSLASANQPAVPWWDAATAVSTTAWRSRSVWTVIDDTTPLGVLDSNDSPVRLDPSDTAAGQLLPYLGLGTSGGVCSDIAARIATAGDPYTAQVVASSKLECAKTIIRYVLGADVFNEGRRTASQGWPPPSPDSTLPASLTNLPDQNQLPDRKFKLGDIFHSSPVIIDPPPPADGILCPNGLHNQCLQSLWQTPVKPAVSGTNPYNLYAHSAPYENRRKVALVGANDGMLHAFKAGDWHANEDDPITTGIDESKPPFNGYYDRGETGNGPEELWAFVPPDLLGKLSQMLSGTHQLYVDGTAMVRDVWVDGAPGNTIAAPAPALDDMKAPSEFHTVAVVGERRGGNHFFALDVTDATKTTSENGGVWVKPKFLWVYPQPGDAASLGAGETYTDFLPVPPPIGPVRIKADANSGRVADANTPTYAVPGVATPVPYHERWVVLLPGGFDPSNLRGRGVHMLDVYSGKEMFDFSYPTAGAAAGDPRLGLTFSVAATPGMVMWGKSAARETPIGSDLVNGGFFDTATFGDVGGQLWTLRFNTPGAMDTNGRVQNWFGGRAFQMGQTSCNGSLCSKADGQPFFYITANASMPNTYLFRVFAGTGDRFNLLDLNGGTCGPDNLRACAQRGCTVTLSSSGNVSAMTGVGSDGRGLAQSACSASSQPAFTSSTDLTGAPPTCGAVTSANIVVASCPGATGATGFTKDVVATCGMDAAGDYGCQTGTSVSPVSGVGNLGATVDITPNWTTYPQARNWYFGLRVFDQTGSRAVFTDATGAAAYDAARYYLNDTVTSPDPLTASVANTSGIAVIDGASDTPTTLTDENGAGWALFYNHGPTVTTGGHTYTVNRLDERTSSVSALYRVLTWNAIQAPTGEATSTTASCKQSKCTAAFRRVAFHYGANPVTGGVILTDSSGVGRRSLVGNTQVPAQGDQPTVFVNQQGQISVGLTAVNPEKGASNVGGTAALDTVMGLGVIEISRDTHDCRHFKAAGTSGLSAAERAALDAKCR